MNVLGVLHYFITYLVCIVEASCQYSVCQLIKSTQYPCDIFIQLNSYPLAILPTWSDLQRLILLQDYNTRVVLMGVTMLGAAAGMVGSFTLLRKRSLMGDALSHATLPGICVAFMYTTMLGISSKSLCWLLTGATLSGLAGVAVILILSEKTKLKEDTALGAVLSIFFGAGIALLGVIQNMQTGHAAGLTSFIYGKTASMSANDIHLITGAGFVSIIACFVIFKELKLLCFDEGFASSKGYPVVLIDIILMAMVVLITIVGLQAVGLVLMIALMVIPAAAARFWTEKLWTMFIISGAIGAISSMLGASASALFERIPSGPMIVLICTAFFLISMFTGMERGLLIKTVRRIRLNNNIDRQHLLRGIYEIVESQYNPIKISDKMKLEDSNQVLLFNLLNIRSWSTGRLKKAIDSAQTERLVDFDGKVVSLTKLGQAEAERLTHQHRLWELYLITHADIAPGRVDREADRIEHVLEPEIIIELEDLLRTKTKELVSSPHKIESAIIHDDSKTSSSMNTGGL